MSIFCLSSSFVMVSGCLRDDNGRDVNNSAGTSLKHGFFEFMCGNLLIVAYWSHLFLAFTIHIAICF